MSDKPKGKLDKILDAYDTISPVGPVLSLVGSLYYNKDLLLAGVLITVIETGIAYEREEHYQRILNQACQPATKPEDEASK